MERKNSSNISLPTDHLQVPCKVILSGRDEVEMYVNDYVYMVNSDEIFEACSGVSGILTKLF